MQAGWNGWSVAGVLCDERVSTRIKGMLYKTVLRPSVYALETVALKRQQLEGAEMKMLRFSLGVTSVERIRNQIIRDTTKVQCFWDRVKDTTLMVRTHSEESPGAGQKGAEDRLGWKR